MVKNYVFLLTRQHEGEALIGELNEDSDYHRIDPNTHTRRSVSGPERIRVNEGSHEGESE
jgi:hypothetical protein